ncbi:MAG: hypothetical protein CVV64_16205 [Candidatus Wallbacteria bacterium HGW-Wallbacteria-1]|uniref:DUF1003 domain-containing protein n=1 Tax=Candidatus Wallbacteria bacterium HGW-Wallbacteria-1 TaxID=2013854 RepID=A0A2N1PL07_9BACT|nr:MAG: hypothetical protein CVV64_16205 [Candidatus Wallbacteria bacterium HGW-Wallbacteria-1]
MKYLKKFINHLVSNHYTIMFLGIIFIISGVVNLSKNLFSDVLGISFDFTQSLIFMGIFNVLLAVSFIIIGTQDIENAISSEPESPQVPNSDSAFNEIKTKIANLEKRILELEENLKSKNTA